MLGPLPPQGGEVPLSLPIGLTVRELLTKDIEVEAG